jgi:predicted HAD superfamily phosphohydrolase YqeG
LIKRILFAIKQAWHYRNSLKQFENNSHLQAKSVRELDLPLLKASGIKVLAIDLDGVMVPYGEDKLTEPLVLWLYDCIQLWTVSNIFIYSNRPGAARKQYFLEFFPGVRLVEVERKKPYPDGIYQIIQKTNVSAEEILVLDDRLLTGILAAIIVGSRAKWITKPMISFTKRPFSELFFILLRALERLLLRW